LVRKDALAGVLRDKQGSNGNLRNSGRRRGQAKAGSSGRDDGPHYQALLADAAVGAGNVCIDLGCGAGHVSRYLGEVVGPEGRVLGIDLDSVQLEAAREDCEHAGLSNVEFRTGNVAEWDEPETYDLVFGRFVLSHLANRPAVVRRMYAALRRGGRLVLEDIDFGGAFS